MKNDSMFGLLGDFKDKEVYEKNPCFWIYTPEGAHRYDIFSCYVADATKTLIRYTMDREKHMTSM